MNEAPILTIAVIGMKAASPLVSQLKEIIEGSSKISVSWLFSTKIIEETPEGAPENLSYGTLVDYFLEKTATRYVLFIESRWKLLPESPVEFISDSIAALEALRSVGRFSQVKLHSEDHCSFEDRSSFSGPATVVGSHRFFVQSPRKIYGGLTLNPAITVTQSLRSLGPFSGYGEDEESVKAQLCMHSAATENDLALRCPNFFSFVPIDQPPYSWKALNVIR